MQCPKYCEGLKGLLISSPTAQFPLTEACYEELRHLETQHFYIHIINVILSCVTKAVRNLDGKIKISFPFKKKSYVVLEFPKERCSSMLKL